MRRIAIVGAALLFLQLVAVSALAQAKLEGRWVGKVKSIQGERDANDHPAVEETSLEALEQRP